MESKAPHTLPEAIAEIHQQGYPVKASLAGGHFQKSMCKQCNHFASTKRLMNTSHFYKQLTREQLARFFVSTMPLSLPLVHPEAFGIVAVEADGKWTCPDKQWGRRRK